MAPQVRWARSPSPPHLTPASWDVPANESETESDSEDILDTTPKRFFMDYVQVPAKRRYIPEVGVLASDGRDELPLGKKPKTIAPTGSFRPVLDDPDSQMAPPIADALNTAAMKNSSILIPKAVHCDPLRRSAMRKAGRNTSPTLSTGVSSPLVLPARDPRNSFRTVPAPSLNMAARNSSTAVVPGRPMSSSSTHQSASALVSSKQTLQQKNLVPQLL
ncbi:hypothetical protein C8R46DRAFT_1065695 [Mycena filopes]|nr:hypothetical protein C8R46DRAFT_1065695 [Mycena filopes]